MKLYIYRGLDGERAPKDTTHVIVDESVAIIKDQAFYRCKHLVSVIMGDNVKRIEWWAFQDCCALRFVRFSKTLEHIGKEAFYDCGALEALFLPSTVKSIGEWAFFRCFSLRLLLLPDDIYLSNIANAIIYGTVIRRQTAVAAGVGYSDSDHRVNEWLFHYMDNSPFHKLCYTSSITTRRINDYLNEHGTDAALAIDSIHGMTPLHMLTMNPNAPAETIAALLDVDVEVVIRLDNKQKTPLEYAREYNVGGLVGIITGLCNHRNSSIDSC